MNDDDDDIELVFNAKVSIFDVIDQIQATLSPEEIVDLIAIFLEDPDVNREFNLRGEEDEEG